MKKQLCRLSVLNSCSSFFEAPSATGFSVFKLLTLSLLACFMLSACSIKKVSYEDDCKIRTYSNFGLHSYISRRYGPEAMVRIAVIPFDVPETFAYSQGVTEDYGVELGNMVKMELVRSDRPLIVENFPEAIWSGKRDDYVNGNFHALSLAQRAGYDMVLLGRITSITPQTEIGLETKIIDVSDGRTIYWSTVRVDSAKSYLDQLLENWNYTKTDNSDFRFPERTSKLVQCTTRAITDTEGIVENETAESEAVTDAVDAEALPTTQPWVTSDF